MAKSDDRSRVWAAVVYPDSAPENWREELFNLHVGGVISPLHEFDINPDGTPKKAHWHVVLSFEGKKSEEQVQKMLAPLHCPKPIRVESIRGMVRYLIHKDNPDKFQYDQAGLVGFSGFNWEQYFDYAEVERRRALKEMRETIRKLGFTEFSDFFDFCDEQHPEWSDLLDKNCAYVISLYITSVRHSLEGRMNE